MHNQIRERNFPSYGSLKRERGVGDLSKILPIPNPSLALQASMTKRSLNQCVTPLFLRKSQMKFRLSENPYSGFGNRAGRSALRPYNGPMSVESEVKLLQPPPALISRNPLRWFVFLAPAPSSLR